MSLSLQVVEKIESKHMPVELLVRLDESDLEIKRDPPKMFKIEKYVWYPDKSLGFSASLISEEVQTCFTEAEELVDIDINRSLKKFNEGLFIAGKHMKKNIVVGKERQQKWFDRDCHQRRQQLRQCLRKFHKSNAYADKVTYTEKRNEYKELLRQKKASYHQSVIDTLDRNKNDPTSFWKTLKNFTKKKSVTNSIEKEDWYQHFYDVFNTFFEKEAENSNNENDDENEDNPY